MEKNKVGMIAIIALLVVMFVALGVGFIYIINLINKTKLPATENVPAISQEYSAKDIDAIALDEKKPITANLLPDTSDNKEHLALVEVNIGLYTGGKDKEAKKEYENIKTIITEKQVIIKHYILEIVRNKTYKELKKPDAQTQLSEEILSCLQDLFQTNAIVEIYFSDFQTM